MSFWWSPGKETAREFLARRRSKRRAQARVEILRILGNRVPSAFMIDPRTGKSFLGAQRETPSPGEGEGVSVIV